MMGWEGQGEGRREGFGGMGRVERGQAHGQLAQGGGWRQNATLMLLLYLIPASPVLSHVNYVGKINERPSIKCVTHQGEES